MSEPIATRLLALAGEEGATDARPAVRAKLDARPAVRAKLDARPAVRAKLDARPAVRAKLDALRRFLLLYAATRSWLWVAVNDELDPACSSRPPSR